MGFSMNRYSSIMLQRTEGLLESSQFVVLKFVIKESSLRAKRFL